MMLCIPMQKEFILPTSRVMTDGSTLTRRDLRPLGAEPANLNSESKADQNALGKSPRSPITEYVASLTQTPATAAPPAAEQCTTPSVRGKGSLARICERVASGLVTRLQRRAPGLLDNSVVRFFWPREYVSATDLRPGTSLRGEGGIDGVIEQEMLELSRVNVKAKRSAGGTIIPRPGAQGLVGAMSTRAHSGVFITTSRLSQGPQRHAYTAPTEIVLVDGAGLANLICHGAGVQVRESYKPAEVDKDFFS